MNFFIVKLKSMYNIQHVLLLLATFRKYNVKYRVIFDNLHQELTCYSLVLGLLRISQALM